MKQKLLLGYVRVSTKEQGKTRNGLEAQVEDIRRFAQYNGYTLVEIAEEVRTGTDDERPVLAEITKRAKKLGAYVVVNRLDRLSRSAIFILQYVHDNPKFIVTMLGENVDPFALHIYAGLAEKERMLISERTRAGLQAKKARGAVLGASQEVLQKSRAQSAIACSEKADAFAARMRPTLKRMIDAGMSFRAIAAELNDNGTKTARGGEWRANTVSNMVARLQ
jgi:DNA invertase Pin-like site-specific DNA recombinase